MKSISFPLFLTALVAIFLVGCSPEEVGPRSQASPLEIQADGATPHAALEMTCTGIDSLQLVTLLGSTMVDDCNVHPCASPNTEWGVVELMDGFDEDGEHVVAMNAQLAFGWFVKNCEAKVGTPVDFLMNNGFPVVDSTWDWDVINPTSNMWEWRGEVASMPSCFSVAARFTIVRRDFFNGEIPGSERVVWAFKSGSLTPFVHGWCPQICPDNTPNGSVITFEDGVEIPAPTCTQSMTGSNLGINNGAEVVCVNSNGNIGDISFNSPGTLVIPAGARVTGGINAPQGGTLIVRGAFIWTGTDNVSDDFTIYIDENGKMDRPGNAAQQRGGR